MNKFKTRYDSLEELYKSHLTKIKNIKFTFREIDLIACIISNKGEKKIASLCDISPRTVSSHVYNIMNKIGCNSKDQIVEFVEFSGKLLVFREYYLHLRVKSYSHKLLAKIGKTNKENINLYVFRSDEAKYPKLFDTLKKDMALANITLEASSEKDQVLSPIIDISEADNNYHMMLFQYINKILDINESISDFDKYYKDIEDMHDGRQSKIASNINIKSIIYKKYFWILILILTGAFIGILGQKNKKEISHNLNRVQEFLALLKDNEISSNNISLDNETKNQSLIKKIEKIVEYSESEEIKEYLNNAEMESQTITNYMHVLQALASYNTYNRHDGEAARKILLIAKNVAENYINARSNLQLNFDELSPGEILSEMQVVKHMPELYTRVIYSLARSYFYAEGGKYLDQSRKYFTIAKYLGEKLNLFEGYLSEFSGILIIDSDDNKKQKEIDSRKIHTIIDKYSKLAENSKEYILDYNPKIEIQAKIIPSQNQYNIISAETYILDNYIVLMNKSDNNFDLYSKEFISRIRNYIKPDTNFLNGKVPQKKIANLYNIIGNGLILMKDRQYNNLETENLFQKILVSDSKDLLEFAEILFEKAASLSRNTYHTKADAFHGLYRIYLHKLDNAELSQSEKSAIEKKLANFQEKKDKINQSLNRQIP